MSRWVFHCGIRRISPGITGIGDFGFRSSEVRWLPIILRVPKLAMRGLKSRLSMGQDANGLYKDCGGEMRFEISDHVVAFLGDAEEIVAAATEHGDIAYAPTILGANTPA